MSLHSCNNHCTVSLFQVLDTTRLLYVHIQILMHQCNNQREQMFFPPPFFLFPFFETFLLGSVGCP